MMHWSTNINSPKMGMPVTETKELILNGCLSIPVLMKGLVKRKYVWLFSTFFVEIVLGYMWGQCKALYWPVWEMVGPSRLEKNSPLLQELWTSLSSQITSLRPIEFCDKQQKSLQEFDQNISPIDSRRIHFILLRMTEASHHKSVDVNNVIFS